MPASSCCTSVSVTKIFRSEATPEEISAILRSFVDDLLMLESGGRHLSLAIDPRMGYRQYCGVFPGGGLVIPNEPGPGFGRRLARLAGNLVALRVSPLRIFRGAKTGLRLLAMRKLVALLGQPQPAPPSPPGLQPSAVES